MVRINAIIIQSTHTLLTYMLQSQLFVLMCLWLLFFVFFHEETYLTLLIICNSTLSAQFITIFKLDCEFTIKTRSWNEPTLNKNGKVSCSRKQLKSDFQYILRCYQIHNICISWSPFSIGIQTVDTSSLLVFIKYIFRYTICSLICIYIYIEYHIV